MISTQKQRPPEVSVIITTYNRCQYIISAVESVLNQSWHDFELIVVDDGSSDKTSELLLPYAAKVEYIYQKNAGVSSARNTGIKKASGKWIAFLDSDDIWYKDKLKKQMDMVTKKNIDICFSAVDLNQRTSSPVLKYTNAVFDEPFNLILKKDLVLYVQAMLIKKELLDRVGLFNEKLQVAEDTDLIYRLAFETPFGYISEPLVYINRQNQRKGLIEILPQVRKKMCAAHIEIVAAACLRCSDKSRWIIKKLRTMLGHFLSIMAALSCTDKDYSKARALAREALRYGGRWRTYRRSTAVYLFPKLVGKIRLHR